ncbi:MAG: AAA family ATPase [Kibdelosporangium sp.]
MFVSRAYVPEANRPENLRRWPFTVPAVAEVVARGFEFTKPVTFFVGDNGSGKSTLVEAIAEGFNLDSRGGRAAMRSGGDGRVKTAFGQVLKLETTVRGARMLGGPRLKKKGFFLRAETAHSMTETFSGRLGYWDENTQEMSHGEGFLTVFGAMFRDPGFYVMDEPESALSFTACLQLVGLMHQLAETGAQVVCATHSPLLAATPGADIVEVGDHGLRRVEWADLQLVDHWRRYLADPVAYLRHITSP